MLRSSLRICTPFPTGADELPDLVSPAPHDQPHGGPRLLDPSIHEVCGLTRCFSARLASSYNWYPRAVQ
jgi:hypothetical protein